MSVFFSLKHVLIIRLKLFLSFALLGILDKNRDTFSADLLGTIAQSSSRFLRSLFDKEWKKVSTTFLWMHILTLFLSKIQTVYQIFCLFWTWNWLVFRVRYCRQWVIHLFIVRNEDTQTICINLERCLGKSCYKLTLWKYRISFLKQLSCFEIFITFHNHNFLLEVKFGFIIFSSNFSMPWEKEVTLFWKLSKYCYGIACCEIKKIGSKLFLFIWYGSHWLVQFGVFWSFIIYYCFNYINPN